MEPDLFFIFYFFCKRWRKLVRQTAGKHMALGSRLPALPLMYSVCWMGLLPSGSQSPPQQSGWWDKATWEAVSRGMIPCVWLSCLPQRWCQWPGIGCIICGSKGPVVSLFTKRKGQKQAEGQIRVRGNMKCQRAASGGGFDDLGHMNCLFSSKSSSDYLVNFILCNLSSPTPNPL